METHQVYVLQNSQGRRYIGLSENILKRLEDHNEGRSKYTSKFGPWELIWGSTAMTLSDARKLENLLKKQKGGRGLELLLEKYRDS